MPEKDHAIWDVHLSWPFRSKEPRRLSPAQRAERRAGVFDRAWRGAVPAVDNGTLQREALARCLRMKRGRADNLWSRARSNRAVILPVLGLLVWAPLTMLHFSVWWSLPPGVPATNPRTNVIASSLLLAFWAAQLIWFLRRNLGILRRAAAGHCPDCNYDLTACPRERGLEAATLGVDIGPACCPECGSFWPLVPPPADGKT